MSRDFGARCEFIGGRQGDAEKSALFGFLPARSGNSERMLS
jgi:hypothetical protein